MESYIHFDNPTLIFSGGQIISGKIEINLRKAKTVRSVTVVFKGKAIVKWSETRSGGKKGSSTYTYSAKETYFKDTIILAEAINGETMELIAGQHIYRFKYLLPPHLPPSYESSNGNIRYSIKGILDRPWKFNHTVKSAFLIETPPDFIENPRIREPVTLTMEKSFGVLMFKSHQPLTGTLHMSHSGFLSDHPIPLTLEINNPSKVSVRGITFELHKIKKFKATNPYKKERVRAKILWKSHIDCCIDAGSSRIIKHQVDVPNFDVMNLTHCNIIDIDYEIKIEVRTVGLHLNMHGKIPIFPMNSISQSIFYPSNNVPNVPTTSFYPTNNATSTSISQENHTSFNIGWTTPKN